MLMNYCNEEIHYYTYLNNNYTLILYAKRLKFQWKYAICTLSQYNFCHLVTCCRKKSGYITLMIINNYTRNQFLQNKNTILNITQVALIGNIFVSFSSTDAILQWIQKKTEQEISHVSFKALPFWNINPDLWYRRIEATSNKQIFYQYNIIL